MKCPKIIYPLLLLIPFIFSSCWDSFVNSRDNKNREAPQEMDSIRIDSSSLKTRPPEKQIKPKRNKALDTLKPGIAMIHLLTKD
ncbi:hypothetical protein [Maribacter flavus]|uniref:Lipoprotein n=1 Tax=Maribacter flavus TaxID=1658664 RepID=A0A5B2TW83_9FLAO|nr:hypothetical protein [Maribacter flavus]KAA2218654.1 hypothetical protein F0361_03250 [Maribacter flavus]